MYIYIYTCYCQVPDLENCVSVPTIGDHSVVPAREDSVLVTGYLDLDLDLDEDDYDSLVVTLLYSCQPCCCSL